MTRASAAHTESCLDDAGWRVGAARVGRPAVAVAVAAGGRGLWAPRVATLGVVAAVAIAILLTFQQLRVERESALRDGAHEVAMRATIVAAQLNSALLSAPKGRACRGV